MNKAGKPYKLQCRKTRAVKGVEAKDHRACVRKLVNWIRAGPCVHSREAHQAMPEEDVDTCSSTSSADTDDEECGVATRKTGGSETVGDGPCSTACPPGGESEGVACASSPGDLAACSSSPAAQQPPRHRCWLCEGDHKEAVCEVYKIVFADAVPVVKNPAALRPIGRLVAGPNPVTLERDLVRTKDVPSDGACLSHALSVELYQSFKPHRGLVSAQKGCERVKDYVLVANDCLGGTTVQDRVEFASGMPFRDYVKHIVQPDSWGGFLEVSLIVQIWLGAPEATTEAPLTVVMLEDDRLGPFKLLSFVGSSAPESRICYIAWQVSHWVRARLKPDGVPEVREWMMRS